VESGDEKTGLRVPARVIPVPASVSAEAQAVLALGPVDYPAYPQVDDVEGWHRARAASEELLKVMLADMPTDWVQVDERQLDGVRAFVITPPQTAPNDTRVYLELHGGIFFGGGDCCRAMGIHTATRLGVRVCTPDYRMPPDHPYPAALDDCVAAYRGLLRDHGPEEIVVAGASGGGNLAAALILRARDEGLPLPAAAVLLTAHLDLTQSGDSFCTLVGVDTVLVHDPMPIALVYAGGSDLTDPYLSPLFGDFSKGFPPTLLASGTRDLFLSSVVRMHRSLRAAGVDADLHVLEAAPHGGFMADTPEDEDLDQEVRRFIDLHCPRVTRRVSGRRRSSLAR
jgi:acetyl esterase/lipase